TIKTHPEWMCQDVNGKRTNRACMNGGYLYEWVPAQMKEIVARYKPAGFAVNGGGGLNYQLCYCQVCTKLFKDKTGHDLPRAVNWQDPVYRDWVKWNADQVIALWDFQNKVTHTAGGPDCHWVGMTRGVVTERNMLRILERSPISFQDHQNRSDASGFQQFTEDGKLTHGVMGWDKIVTASQALYGPRMTTTSAAMKPRCRSSNGMRRTSNISMTAPRSQPSASSIRKTIMSSTAATMFPAMWRRPGAAGSTPSPAIAS